MTNASELLAQAHEAANKPLVAVDIRSGNVGRQGVMWVETTTALSAIELSQTQVIDLSAQLAEMREAGRHLLDMIEAQGRHPTPTPKRESADDANSRDERDQVFADAMERLRALLANGDKA